MYIRAYLRVSTKDQSIERQRKIIDEFCAFHRVKPVAYYSESISGASKDRPEMQRLIDDASVGDILIAESVDRVSRMTYTSWQALRGKFAEKRIGLLFVDLPITHNILRPAPEGSDPIESRMTSIINEIMVEMMAAFAQKNYLLMKQRQRQGIERAKALGIYQVKAKQMAERRIAIERLLIDGSYTWRKIMELTGATMVTINDVKKRLVREGKITKETRSEQYKKRRLQKKIREEEEFKKNHIELLREQCEKYGLKILEDDEASPIRAGHHREIDNNLSFDFNSN